MDFPKRPHSESCNWSTAECLREPTRQVLLRRLPGTTSYRDHQDSAIKARAKDDQYGRYHSADATSICQSLTLPIHAPRTHLLQVVVAHDPRDWSQQPTDHQAKDAQR